MAEDSPNLESLVLRYPARVIVVVVVVLLVVLLWGVRRNRPHRRQVGQSHVQRQVRVRLNKRGRLIVRLEVVLLAEKGELLVIPAVVRLRLTIHLIANVLINVWKWERDPWVLDLRSVVEVGGDGLMLKVPHLHPFVHTVVEAQILIIVLTTK